MFYICCPCIWRDISIPFFVGRFATLHGHLLETDGLHTYPHVSKSLGVLSHGFKVLNRLNPVISKIRDNSR